MIPGKMVDLGRKSSVSPNPVPQTAIALEDSSAKQYPYGCCISLDDDTMAKLGLDGDMPAPGDVVEFAACACVTSASKDPTTGCCRVELQITDMAVIEVEDPAEEAMERSEARRKRFYGANEGDQA